MLDFEYVTSLSCYGTLIELLDFEPFFYSKSSKREREKERERERKAERCGLAMMRLRSRTVVVRSVGAQRGGDSASTIQRRGRRGAAGRAKERRARRGMRKIELERGPWEDEDDEDGEDESVEAIRFEDDEEDGYFELSGSWLENARRDAKENREKRRASAAREKTEGGREIEEDRIPAATARQQAHRRRRRNHQMQDQKRGKEQEKMKMSSIPLAGAPLESGLSPKSVMAVVAPRLAARVGVDASAREKNETATEDDAAAGVAANGAVTTTATTGKALIRRYMRRFRACACIEDVMSEWDKYGEDVARVLPQKIYTGQAAACALHRIASMSRHNKMRSIDLEELGRSDEVTELIDAFVENLDSCTPSGVVQVMWSISVMGAAFSFSVDHISAIVRGRLFRSPEEGTVILNRLRADQLKDIAWSLGKFQFKDADFLRAVQAAFTEKLDGADAKMVAAVLWSCAVTNVQPLPELLDGAISQWPLEAWSSFSLCNCVWSLAVLELENSHAFAVLWNRLVDMGISGELELATSAARNEKAELLQIYQALIAIRHNTRRSAEVMTTEGDADDTTTVLREMPHHVQRRAAMCWARYLGRKSQHISAFQRNVAYIIGNLGYNPKIEDNEAGFAVDIALKIAGLKLAVEIDGPSHLTTNTQEPLGNTLFKCRMLEASGWSVVTVPIHEWDRCATDDAKETLVLNKMKKYLKKLFRDEEVLEARRSMRMRQSQARTAFRERDSSAEPEMV